MLEFALGMSAAQKGAARSASLARSMGAGDAGRQANLLEDMNDQFDRILLIIQAMWALMEEQGFTEEQLIAKIQELDSQDGSVDGRARSAPSDCRECGSKVAAGLIRCQICGSEIPGVTPSPFA